MRRPVDVKGHFRFLLSLSLFPFSQAASVAILPSALSCERYSLGARWVFSVIFAGQRDDVSGQHILVRPLRGLIALCAA